MDKVTRIVLLTWAHGETEVFSNLKKLCDTYKEFKSSTIQYHWRKGDPYYRGGNKIERKVVK